MKKLLLALALACTMQVAFAQKSDADMQKAVEKAVAASLDAKKATKAATWVNLGKAYLTAYTNPTSAVAPGVDRATWDLMSKEKPTGEEVVTVNGAQYNKLTYSHVDIYFNAAGQLEFAVVTKPSVEGDLLMEAAKAYAKSFELGAKEKDVNDKLTEIVNHYNAAAYSAYTLGDMAKASKLFKGAADVAYMAPCTAPGDDSAFNAALTAVQIEDYDTAL